MCTYPSASCLTFFALKVCERSLSSKQGGPSMPLVQPFIRGEMLPSGFLIRPSDGGGSIIHIVDHMDLEVIYDMIKQVTNSNLLHLSSSIVEI